MKAKYICVMLLLVLNRTQSVFSIRNLEDGQERCTGRLEASLESLKKRQNSGRVSSNLQEYTGSLLDLAGYSLHQPMRSAPYDMYVTSMRVRVPERTGWYRIEQCYYDNRNRSIEARILFRDLSITGQVRLYEDGAIERDPLLPEIAETCSMTFRLRRASLNLNAAPKRPVRQPLEVATSASFTEPHFFSVYAYGCRPPRSRAEHRMDVITNDSQNKQFPAGNSSDNEFSHEMEDVFLRGIKSLIKLHMEKQLKGALRDTLMQHLGYTISYGR